MIYSLNRFLKLVLVLFIFVVFITSCATDNSSEDASSSAEDASFELSSSHDSLSSESKSEPESESDSSIASSENSDFSKETESDDYSELSEISQSAESSENSEISEASETSEDNEKSDSNDSVDIESSFVPENPSDSSEDIPDINAVFSQPESITYTTEKGNTFYTNCTDEIILSLMEEIADTASKYNKASVYYTDTKQKYFFAFGTENVHNTASTIKAPYASYLLQSDVDLSEVLIMEKRHVLTGSGVLKNKPVGSSFTVKELIKYMITRSDNTAYAMLLERFGTQGFREYAKSLGVNYRLPAGGYTTCTIMEMAIFMFDIYSHSETENGKFLIDCMKNCSYSLQIPKAVSHKVAHKFGFIYEGKGFHDMAIVYAPTPYIELIFTRINGDVYDTKGFIEIGKLVEKLNSQLSDVY